MFRFADAHSLHSSEKFCTNAPILIDFFLKFLQRNRAFPEIDRQNRKAISVARKSSHTPFPTASSLTLAMATRRSSAPWTENPASGADEADDSAEERSAKRHKTDPGDADNASRRGV